MGLSLVLWALFAFQLKHFLCDFVLQTKFQVDKKKVYGHVGGLVHAGLHAIMTVPIVIVMGASATIVVLLFLGELILHYHVDWLKGQIDIWSGWTEKDHTYWVVFGADQLVHQITYVGVVAFLAGAL
ncbi:MAG TPA: DUF3307 domain-containing protein [Acetobacteraceae bacterium]|nr:DUF3307 domain-containing protein [Acetobacteraceae bacterium]